MKVATLNEEKEKKDKEIAEILLRISREGQTINQLRVSIQKLDKDLQFIENSNGKLQQN